MIVPLFGKFIFTDKQFIKRQDIVTINSFANYNIYV